MFQLIANVLAWFYDLVPNYAAAIALLTLAIMVLLTPLTLKGTKSMLELQRLQPEMRRLQQQHKGDRQKLNEEMMALYKEHRINPLGGCLPAAAAGAGVLHLVPGPARPDASLSPADDRHAGACNPTVPERQLRGQLPQPRHLAVAGPGSGNTMIAFGIDLADSAVKVIGDSFVKGLPYLALVLVVAATSYYQQRQISARQTNQVPTRSSRCC